jgi:hypothetical protein
MADYMDHVLKEAAKTWLHPDNFNTQDSLWPNPQTQPPTYSTKAELLNNRGKEECMTASGMEYPCNTDQVTTACLTLVSLPIGLQAKDKWLWQPILGTQTGSYVTHNVNPDDRDSFQNVGFELHTYTDGHARHHCISDYECYISYQPYSVWQMILTCIMICIFLFAGIVCCKNLHKLQNNESSCSELSSGLYCRVNDNPEDSSEHHTRRRENLKSHNESSLFADHSNEGLR